MNDPFRWLYALLLTLCSGLSLAATALPEDEPVPGGVAIVPLASRASSPPVVHFGRHRVAVVRTDAGWTAVVGIPLSTRPGRQRIRVSEAGRERTIPFEVGDKTYRSQHLTIKNKRKVNPTTLDLERIRKESARIHAAFADWSETPPASLRMPAPIPGIRSSSFGLRRFFNGQPRKPHSGMDIAAPVGTPVHLPLAGRVLETGNFFFNGNTVMVEHGQGLVTLYCHLHTIAVEPGQTLPAGTVIGTVGRTGRVTGPHLHWSVSLNDARVDPALFLEPVAPASGPSTSPH